jgi:hypothetical protein
MHAIIENFASYDIEENIYSFDIHVLTLRVACDVRFSGRKYI